MFKSLNLIWFVLLGWVFVSTLITSMFLADSPSEVVLAANGFLEGVIVSHWGSVSSDKLESIHYTVGWVFGVSLTISVMVCPAAYLAIILKKKVVE